MATEYETPLNSAPGVQSMYYGTSVNSDDTSPAQSSRCSSQENLMPSDQTLFGRIQARITKLASHDASADNRRTLTTISGVAAPVALSMFGTLLFQRIGKAI